MAQVPVAAVTDKENPLGHENGNGELDKELGTNEPIIFGSIEQESAKGDGNGVADSNFPKDVVDEWPAPKQIHSFYFVRYRVFEDPKLKAKLDQADKEIQKKNQSRFQLTEEFKAKRSEKSELINRLKALTDENRQYKTILDEKKKEIEPLQQALGKLRTASSGGRYGLCSSEEELNDLIYSLKYRIQHESIPLTEEKQILKEIKQLEGTREKVIANAAMRAKLQDSLGQKEAIQDQVKLLGVDLDGVKKEKQSQIDNLVKEIEAVTKERDKAYENIQELRKQRDEGNAHFYQNRALLNKAKDLAAKKDVKALEELSLVEVDKFMSLWSSNKIVRDDYEKRILPSLDSRQLSKDGRIRNPEEKPLLAVEAPIASVTESVVKASVKRPKEDSKSVPEKDAKPTQKVQKETSKTDSKTTLESIDTNNHDFGGPEKQQKNPPVEEQVDEAKLKERRREEMEQAKERKKKLAEKKAAKEARRAEKEAEKKLKEISSSIFEREKKLRKKAAASSPATAAEPEEIAETVAPEAAEAEKDVVKDKAAAPVKEKVRGENSLRPRNRPRGGTDSLPKAMLRRKKSTNYWKFAIPAALLVLVLLVLGYFYLL
ncbi:hypothetical protein K2173_014359 [Erythroxylum novogranatense]|uniref:Proton pump-interactor 1 n=1 Tax=Erythroxylum novogranatense TaxID=1862640 RepID=A0AAV8S698_9ROSI|nr:hypothetical protein K2173_014359 [Erythroxylum novogranatense]